MVLHHFLIARDERPNTSALPPEEENRRLDQFVCWKYVQRKGRAKPTKEPFQPKYPGRKARTNDRRTWGDYATAVAVAAANPAMAGIGYVHSDEDELLSLDFDQCRNRQSGEISPFVKEQLKRLGGYQEVSPSGEGVHCTVKGKLRGSGRCGFIDGHKVEVYDKRRFLTYSGNPLPSAPGRSKPQGHPTGDRALAGI